MASQLEEKDAIRDVMSSYCFYVDSGEFEKFAELFTDRQNAGDEENRKLLVDKFQGYALPFYMTLGPDGVERSRILGKVSEPEFIEFLKKGLQGPPAGK